MVVIQDSSKILTSVTRVLQYSCSNLTGQTRTGRRGGSGEFSYRTLARFLHYSQESCNIPAVISQDKQEQEEGVGVQESFHTGFWQDSCITPVEHFHLDPPFVPVLVCLVLSCLAVISQDKQNMKKGGGFRIVVIQDPGKILASVTRVLQYSCSNLTRQTRTGRRGGGSEEFSYRILARFLHHSCITFPPGPPLLPVLV